MPNPGRTREEPGRPFAGDVWIVLPTYNEADNVEWMVRELDVRLTARCERYHVLVVDDASPDGTGAIADRLAEEDARVRVLHRPGKDGLAEAYLAGFAYALAHDADVVVQMDCDGSHHPGALPRLLRALEDGADVAIGSRYVAGGGTDWTAGRRLLSRLGSLYARQVLGVRVRDLTGGFKAFRADVLRTVELSALRCKGFGFQIETTYRALREGFTVREVAIRFTDRRRGESKMTWRIALEAFDAVPRLRLRRRRVRPRADGPLRVLMLTRGVVPVAPGAGGAELAAFQLSRAVVAGGHEVTLVSDHEDTDADEFPKLRVVSVDSRLVRAARRVPGAFPNWLARHLAGNLAVVLRARRVLAGRSHDLVHAHGALSAVLMTLVCRVPVVYTEHDAPPWLCRYRSRGERIVRRVLYRTLNVTAFRRADRVGATFAALRDDMERRFGVRGRKIATIANGTDLSVFSAPTMTPADDLAAELVRRDPRFVAGDDYCLFVGRLESRKAPDVAVRALVSVPEGRCVFAGDGPMREPLERLAETLGVRDRVAFLGYLRAADLPALYAGARLLLLPSVSEAMPLVVLEAMACGTPVLASRIAGLPSVVRDYETGLLVEPGSVGELALALRFLLRDPELLRRMSHEARRTVHRRFVWPVVAAEYVSVYRTLAGGPPPTAVTHPSIPSAVPELPALEASS